MPYIPHTKQDEQEMFKTIGIDSIDALFSEIPKELIINGFADIPPGLNEFEVIKLMDERFRKDRLGLCFIGAGAYSHYIPTVVNDLISRSEFLTAYTPYQAEASQGTLQVIYEYQSMMSSLMKMEVSNASMYDGASSLAESILMSLRLQKNEQAKTILLPRTLNPAYYQVIKTFSRIHNFKLIELPFDLTSGKINIEALQQYETSGIAALVIQQPNFFGVLEEVDDLSNWAHQHGIMIIGSVNPIAVSLLKAPGEWGQKGADIVAGEGQPLGVPLAYGGPYFGYLCTRKEYVRQMPGRVVGKTIDKTGATGFVLTLQAREQHIRRAKATSNICSNQALLATAATVYMSLLGEVGMKQVASVSHFNANLLREKLLKIKGVEAVFKGEFFHEFVVKVNKPVEEVLNNLAIQNIYGGYNLKLDYPELGESLLICVTETKNEKDLNNYVSCLEKIL